MSITMHAGQSGMGKTHALVAVCERWADAGWRVEVWDAKREWARHSKRGALVTGPLGADAAHASGEPIAVWTVRDTRASWGRRPSIDALAAYALEHGPGVLVAVPECHRAWPRGCTPGDASAELLTGFRHKGLAVLLDVQRLNSCSTMCRENLDLCRIFGVNGKTDLRDLADWGGQALADAASECAARRHANGCRGNCGDTCGGERGWYVEFSSPVGPYIPRRFV